jgi:hypothetical protein
MGEVCSMQGKIRNVGLYKFVVVKCHGKRPFGRLTRMLVDNIKTDLKDIGCEGKDWINVALGIVQ